MGIIPTFERSKFLFRRARVVTGFAFILALCFETFSPVLANKPPPAHIWRQCANALIGLSGERDATKARPLHRSEISPEKGFIAGLPQYNPELMGLSLKKKLALLPHLTEAALADRKIFVESLLPLLTDMNKKSTGAEDGSELQLSILRTYWRLYEPGSPYRGNESLRNSFFHFLDGRKAERSSPIWSELSRLASRRLKENAAMTESPDTLSWELEFLDLIYEIFKGGPISPRMLGEKLYPVFVARASAEKDYRVYEALSKAFWVLQQGYDDDAKAEIRGYLASILNQIDAAENIEAFRSHLFTYNFTYDFLYSTKIQLEFFIQEMEDENLPYTAEIKKLVREIEIVLALHIEYHRANISSQLDVERTSKPESAPTEEQRHFASFTFIPDAGVFREIVKEPLSRIISQYPDDEDLWTVLHHALREIPRFQADLRKLNREEEANNLEAALEFLRTWEEDDARRKVGKLRSQMRNSLVQRSAPDSDLKAFENQTKNPDLLLSFDQVVAFGSALSRYQRSRSHGIEDGFRPENDYQKELAESLNYQGFQSPVGVYFGYPRLISSVAVEGVLARAAKREQGVELKESDIRYITYVKAYLAVRWGVLGDSVTKRHWEEIMEIYEELLRDQTR